MMVVRVTRASRGAALILVLWLVASLSLVVLAGAQGLRQQTQRTALDLERLRAESVLDAGVQLTAQRLLQEKPQMRIVADQIGAPTWAGTIADSTRALIERWQAGQAGEWGVYHLTAQGETSWFGFAEAIGQHLRSQGKDCAELEAIPSSAYPTPARRPLNSRLDCSRLQQQWHVSQPQWHDALRECLAEQH